MQFIQVCSAPISRHYRRARSPQVGLCSMRQHQAEADSSKQPINQCMSQCLLQQLAVSNLILSQKSQFGHSSLVSKRPTPNGAVFRCEPAAHTLHATYTPCQDTCAAKGQMVWRPMPWASTPLTLASQLLIHYILMARRATTLQQLSIVLEGPQAQTWSRVMSTRAGCGACAC
jgi:hypothetical protein